MLRRDSLAEWKIGAVQHLIGELSFVLDQVQSLIIMPQQMIHFTMIMIMGFSVIVRKLSSRGKTGQHQFANDQRSKRSGDEGKKSHVMWGLCQKFIDGVVVFIGTFQTLDVRR